LAPRISSDLKIAQGLITELRRASKSVKQLGVARLAKVTVISPRSEYEEVAKALAQFEDFHPIAGGSNFDPAVQELTVKAVRLFAQADQAVKDLGLQLMPGQMDIVFRGAKVTKSEFEAGAWEELLGKAETQLAPIAEQVRGEKASLQRATKDETDAGSLMSALGTVSTLFSDLSGLSELRLLKAVVAVVGNERLDEFRNALPEGIFLSQPLSKGQSFVLVAVRREDETKLDRAMKLLELKPLVIPAEFPQNPAEAYLNATQDFQAATAAREKIESRMADLRLHQGTTLLAVRELTEVGRRMLDEARVSGSMKRLATISGYIPAKKEAKMNELFGRWMVHTEGVSHETVEEHVPTLLENAPGLNIFQKITMEQGIPGGPEVDPTPLVSFVFPIFFGMMFADVGHGLILTLFMLLVRQRGFGSMRQWANIFLVAGISSMVFGAVFGEFFELSFNSFVPIPPVIEVIKRVAGSADSFNIDGVYLVMEVAILIGVAHLVTALSLDIYQGVKEHNRLELALEKVPALTMYLSGVGYGLAFIGAGFSFNVLKTSAPAPLLGIPNSVLGGISVAVLLPSMLWLMVGRSVAVSMGKVKGESAVGALSNGGLEVFERISQFLSNTVSYVRLAVMLLVHAGLLLITNLYFGPSGILAPWPTLVPIWIVLNLMIVAFEVFIVYVQDLRLHLYEFFTKFFLGRGTPFRKILPDRVRIRINWR
jgi:V/A-type H+-transporting ATPase subunit I